MLLWLVDRIALIWVEACQIYKLISNQQVPTQWNIIGGIESLSTQNNYLTFLFFWVCMISLDLKAF